MGVNPLPVYLYDEKSSCDIHLGVQDTTDPSSFGTCVVTHGKNVYWIMFDGTRYNFEYTHQFESYLGG